MCLHAILLSTQSGQLHTHFFFRHPTLYQYGRECDLTLNDDRSIRRICPPLSTISIPLRRRILGPAKLEQTPRIVLVLRVSPWNDQKREYLSAFLTKVALPLASSAIHLTSLDNVGGVACRTEHVSSSDLCRHDADGVEYWFH